MIKTQTAVTTAASAVLLGASVLKMVQTNRRERAKRLEMKSQLATDLEAIRTAQVVVRARFENGFYRGWTLEAQLDDLNNEIKFQKIVLTNA